MFRPLSRFVFSAFSLLSLACGLITTSSAAMPNDQSRLRIENGSAEVVTMQAVRVVQAGGQAYVVRLNDDQRHMQPGQGMSFDLPIGVTDDLIQVSLVLSTREGTRVATISLSNPQRDGDQSVRIIDEDLPRRAEE